MPDSPTSQRLGRFIETSAAGEKVRAFVPPPLPPEPAIDVLALLEKLSLAERALGRLDGDRKSTRLNSSHSQISYAVFCLKKKKNTNSRQVFLVCSEL